MEYFGHISCYSEVDLGTTFRVYFLEIQENRLVPDPDNDDLQQLPKETETILIVDDEEAVITLTQKMLNQLSYKTISASTGESALAIYTEKYNEIDLILLDLGMQGMGGKKCLAKLIEFDSNVKVIVASGYSEEGLIKENIKAGAKDYAIKPFCYCLLFTSRQNLSIRI